VSVLRGFVGWFNFHGLSASLRGSRYLPLTLSLIGAWRATTARCRGIAFSLFTLALTIALTITFTFTFALAFGLDTAIALDSVIAFALFIALGLDGFGLLGWEVAQLGIHPHRHG
jgi:hypothetical protein